MTCIDFSIRNMVHFVEYWRISTGELVTCIDFSIRNHKIHWAWHLFL